MLQFKNTRVTSCKNQGGYVILIVLAITGAIVISGIAMMKNVGFTQRMSAESKKYSQTRYAGEAAASLAINKAANLNSRGILPDLNESFSVLGHSANVKINMERDLSGNVKVIYNRGRFDMLSYTSYGNVLVSVTSSSNQKINIRERVRFEEYPIFQFERFYEGSFQTVWGTGADIHYQGRIHSNAGICLWDQRNVAYHDWVTACCFFYETRQSSNKTVPRLKFANVDDGSLQVNWRPYPSTYYTAWTPIDTPNCPGNGGIDDGRRKKVAYGTNAVPLDLFPAGEHPICLIKPKDVNEFDQYVPGYDSDVLKKKKLVYRANLILRKTWSGIYPILPSVNWYVNKNNGTDTLSSHNDSLKTLSVLPDLDTNNTPANCQDLFFDYSQRKWLTVTYIDLENLISKLELHHPNVNTIYLQGLWNDSLGAHDIFILKNCDSLARNISIATNCPLYVWGHYNVVNPIVNSALICDKFLLLSPNWKSTYRELDYVPGDNATSYSNLRAHRWGLPTTLNTCIMSGAPNSPTFTNYNTPGNPYYFLWHSCPENNHEVLQTTEFNVQESFQYHGSSSVDKWITCNGSVVRMWRSAYFNDSLFASIDNRATVYTRPFYAISFDSRYNIHSNQPPSVPTVTAPMLVDHFELR